jgi:hypothetical protein
MGLMCAVIVALVLCCAAAVVLGMQTHADQQNEQDQHLTVPPCETEPCFNGGVCVDKPELRVGFKCACPDRYLGPQCEVDMESCASAPCQHNSTCVNGLNTFHCTCRRGYTGELCETDVLSKQLIACQRIRCLNGGRCRAESEAGKVFCQCQTGYSGQNCQNVDPTLDVPTGAGTRHEGLGVDIGFGNGVDVTEVFGADGSLDLKFAPLFSRHSGEQPVLNNAQSQTTTTRFYATYEDFLRHVLQDLQVHPYQRGMLSADTWVAEVRQHSYSAPAPATGIVFGRSQRTVVVEEKSYPACTPSYNSAACLQLHQPFVDAIRELPESLDSSLDLEAYFSFLVTYGTHYVSKELFGGQLTLEYFVRLTNDTSIDAIQTLATSTFDTLLNSDIATFVSGSETYLRAQIPHITQIEAGIRGGHSSHSQAGSFAQWQSNLPNYTALVGAELEPIAELATDATKRLLLSQAIDAFLLQCLPPNAAPTAAVCSERGECRTMTGTCICDSGYYGAQCAMEACPSSHPSMECSGHGTCDSSTGVCTCAVNTTTGNPLWIGADCSRDFNECAIAGNNCELYHRQCINTLGGYFCPEACVDGYELDDNGFCMDIDECQTPGVCTILSTCRNIDGAFQCILCPDGHQNDGDGCVDINECNENNNECAVAHRECINTQGRFSCGACLPGYAFDSNAFCVDADQCAGLSTQALINLCGEGQDCIEMPGGFINAAGGVGYDCACAVGWQAASNGTCTRTQCLPYVAQHSQPGMPPCTGYSGDECVVTCAQSYIATGPARCQPNGEWADGQCLFECPTVQVHGDCNAIGNQAFSATGSLVNGKPHYVDANGTLNIYFDSELWIIDDDLDSHEVHAHLFSRNTFPTGRQMWVVWCGMYYGWTEMVLDIECSGVCSDTCGAHNDDGVCDDGGHAAVASDCAFGSDCSDCGSRQNAYTDACYETVDMAGHTCFQYRGIGYQCQELVHVYGRDCACTCPELYLDGADSGNSTDQYTCPCPASCTWQVSAFVGQTESCECHNC